MLQGEVKRGKDLVGARVSVRDIMNEEDIVRGAKHSLGETEQRKGPFYNRRPVPI